MRVIATKRGFIHSHLKEIDAEFEIPDTPLRRLRDDDDDLTKKVAVKGQVPVKFASSWMIPASMRPKRMLPDDEPEDLTSADLNAMKI